MSIYNRILGGLVVFGALTYCTRSQETDFRTKETIMDIRGCEFERWSLDRSGHHHPSAIRPAMTYEDAINARDRCYADVEDLKSEAADRFERNFSAHECTPYRCSLHRSADLEK